MKTSAHTRELAIVVVIKNANFAKNCRVHSQRIEPLITVVTAEATIDTPIVASAYCVRSPLDFIAAGAST
jgi:hypothetical protein